LRAARERPLLRFATVRVNQFRSRTRREPDVRPILRRVPGLERWTDYSRRHKLVETAWTATFVRGSRRNKLRNDPAVRRDRDTLARFNAADVATEIVFQLANAR
jgi:hypothetical protein